MRAELACIPGQMHVWPATAEPGQMCACGAVNIDSVTVEAICEPAGRLVAFAYYDKPATEPAPAQPWRVWPEERPDVGYATPFLVTLEREGRRSVAWASYRYDYERREWSWPYEYQDHVIAWQPLPEPYRG